MIPTTKTLLLLLFWNLAGWKSSVNAKHSNMRLTKMFKPKHSHISSISIHQTKSHKFVKQRKLTALCSSIVTARFLTNEIYRFDYTLAGAFRLEVSMYCLQNLRQIKILTHESFPWCLRLHIPDKTLTLDGIYNYIGVGVSLSGLETNIGSCDIRKGSLNCLTFRVSLDRRVVTYFGVYILCFFWLILLPVEDKSTPFRHQNVPFQPGKVSPCMS